MRKFYPHGTRQTDECVFVSLATIKHGQVCTDTLEYPDDKIIRELVKRKIPIVLGSDSHYPKYLAFNFDKTLSKLKKMQFEEKTQVNLCKFSNREKILIKLDSIYRAELISDQMILMLFGFPHP